VNFSRREGRPLVVGHRGAAGVARENTLASLGAGVEAGCDVIEFDVGEGLVLAHSSTEVPAEAITLDDALEFLGSSGVAVHVDLKSGGIESEVVAAVRRHGLADRAIVSAAFARWLRRTAAVAPDLPRAIGYPRDRLGVSEFEWPRRLTDAGVRTARTLVPARVPLLLRTARATALSLHCALVSRAAVEASHRLGAPVIAWTANDPEVVRRIVSDGVDAICSDHPRTVFETLATL
jgi:glycerophosphoryl diester phosphodiesterase